MERLILNDKTELEIHDGAVLSQIVADVDDYSSIAELAEKLTPENLKVVQFASEKGEGYQEEEAYDPTVYGIYTDMVLSEPHFKVTVKEEGGLFVAFGLRYRTREEIQQETVNEAIKFLSDEQAEKVKSLYPQWKPIGRYEVGDRCLYEDILYRCLQAHDAQETWNPKDAPSLWAKILTSDDGEILEWEQPDSTNGYHTGDKVTHNGKTWESLVDNNVWEPGIVGTESVWKEIS